MNVFSLILTLFDSRSGRVDVAGNNVVTKPTETHLHTQQDTQQEHP